MSGWFVQTYYRKRSLAFTNHVYWLRSCQCIFLITHACLNRIPQTRIHFVTSLRYSYSISIRLVNTMGTFIWHKIHITRQPINLCRNKISPVYTRHFICFEMLWKQNRTQHSNHNKNINNENNNNNNKNIFFYAHWMNE